MLRCNVSFLASLGLAMKVWITCFVLLFGAAEALQWVQHFSLPLPMLILGGALLAIASNYDKLKNFPFHLDYGKPEVLQESVLTERASVPQSDSPKVEREAQREPTRSRTISFTISKTHQLGD